MDKLEAELEGYKSVRLRQSAGARRLSERGEITPHYSRKYHGNEGKRWSIDSMGSTASTSLEAARQRTAFVWQMPFTVKCIGTFRYCVCVCVHMICLYFGSMFKIVLIMHFLLKSLLLGSPRCPAK